MKPLTLNLLIVDENKLIIDSLNKYLNDRFGTRVNISSCCDEESCIEKMDEQMHVIILDYFLDSEAKGTKNGLEIFNSIKKQSPKTEVTMITSNESILEATLEMQRGASDYILKRERYLKKISRLFNQAVTHPIRNRIVIPIQKIIENYTLQDYLVMFVVVFLSTGTLVFVGLKIFH